LTHHQAVLLLLGIAAHEVSVRRLATGIVPKNPLRRPVSPFDVGCAQMQRRQLVESAQELFLKAPPLQIEPLVAILVLE
jgi:hypothetical protein